MRARPTSSIVLLSMLLACTLAPLVTPLADAAPDAGPSGVVSIKVNPRKATDYRWTYSGRSGVQSSASGTVRIR